MTTVRLTVVYASSSLLRFRKHCILEDAMFVLVFVMFCHKTSGDAMFGANDVEEQIAEESFQISETRLVTFATVARNARTTWSLCFKLINQIIGDGLSIGRWPADANAAYVQKGFRGLFVSSMFYLEQSIPSVEVNQNMNDEGP